ncbi:MAG: uroporphyrinogen decarboxylase [Pseudomonadota bacterium]
MQRATRFIDACYCKPTDCTPVWLMRQAGRYQASYQRIRKKFSFAELCRNPELAAQITVNAVNEFEVDAAIIFSDILVPVQAMGAPVEFSEQGPVLNPPVRNIFDVQALEDIDSREKTPFVAEAIRLAKKALGGQVPLIGFAGGPITLAAYLVEGGHSQNFVELKKLLFSDPKTGHVLLGKLSNVISQHLEAQIEAGCDAIQLFESWGGVLGPDDFREFALPYHKQIFSELAECKVPRIFFGTSISTLLEQIQQTGADVIGVDWRVALDEARRRLGPKTAIQGNLDPCCLFMDEESLKNRIQNMLIQAGTEPGYIFNLGHGVLPSTPPENVRFLVETVHKLSSGKIRA